MSLALLGPSFGVTENEARAVSKDLYIAFDLSQSMNANDVEPTRLDKAKAEAVTIANSLDKNRLGLMVFNSQTEILSSLTFDQSRIKSLILNLKTTILPKGSTDLNEVLKSLIEKFKNTDKLQAAVIITDGESLTELDENQIANLKGKQIRLVFLVVGTNQGSTISTANGLKKDSDGNTVISKINLPYIANICNKTAGAYFVLNKDQNQVNELLTYLSEMKSSVKPVAAITYNKYIYFLFPALILLIIDFLTTVNVLKI